MIIYSICPPVFTENKVDFEMFSCCESGFEDFYKKDSLGNVSLLFSTDPKKYLKEDTFYRKISQRDLHV